MGTAGSHGAGIGPGATAPALVEVSADTTGDRPEGLDERTVLTAIPGPVVSAVVGLSYVALAQYVIWLNDPVNAGAGYWPAAGLTLVALLLLPVRRWGWVVGAVVVAELGGDAVHGYPLAASSWWAAGNVAEPVVAALLLRRLGHGARLAPLGALVPLLLAGVVVGPLVGAAIGSIGTSTEYDTSQVDVLLKWWAGDGLGVLVVAPLLLCFREPAVSGRSRPEVAATATVVVAVTLVSFRDWSQEWDVVLAFLVFPVMMLASVRLGIRGAAIIGFVVAELANLATAIGHGPFNLVGDDNPHAITVLQVFLASVLTTALVTATLVHDALEHTKKFEGQRSVANAFQRAALPQRLPAVPGLALAARYVPAAADDALHVGGDWYDAFPLQGDATAFVVGDVTGHDLGAAVTMGQLRNGLRSLLTELGDPGRALAAMDRQLAATSPDLTLATVIIAVYDDGDLRWANAGHPPLLFAPAAGPVRYLCETPDPLLGLGQSSYDTHHTRLNDGDLVVAFTDGVAEHRTWPLDDALEHLAQLVATAPSRDPQSLGDRLLAHGLDGRRRDDDACVVVISRVHLDV
jgi:integral membrane sensor domain MASE1